MGEKYAIWHSRTPVREVFHDKFAFSYSGMAKATTKEQLQRFYLSLKDHGYKSIVKPSNWIEAFYMLEQFLNDLPEGKTVVFLDELPWMDAPKSSFMPAFENFWNGWASARKDVLLISLGRLLNWGMSLMSYIHHYSKSPNHIWIS